MNTDIVEVRVGEARIEIPHAVVVQNFLASLGPAQPQQKSTQHLRVGEMWEEQGGIYAGIMRGDDCLYHLIICPARQMDTPSLEWGPVGKTTAATSNWDGLGNTLALTGDKHPAAQHCAAMDANGFSDWYLPARREASLCAATCPDAFSEGWHWTSTQYSAHGAHIQDFSDGHQHNRFKDGSYRVRAVRRFIIN